MYFVLVHYLHTKKNYTHVEWVYRGRRLSTPYAHASYATWLLK